MQIQTIPLSQLSPHPRNVRKTGGTSIHDLACSIAANGLMHPLVVMPLGNGFEVVAGARRLAAIKVLADDRLLPAGLADGVPCNVIASGSVTELSLAENVIRQAMHPADEFEAFQALIDQGQDIGTVATRFGVKQRHVEERLRLANVAPELLEVYRTGGMTLEQVMALTVVDDHAAQIAAWGDENTSSWERTPNHLRESLVESSITSDEGIAQFVGLDAYTDAGGTIRPDLFSEIVVLEDGALVNRLATAKLKERADQLKCEGWGWVEPVLNWPFSERYKYQQVADAKPMPLLGAIVTIASSGKFEIHKGLLKPGEKAPKGTKPKGEKAPGSLKNPMHQVDAQLTTVRTGVVRAHLRANPRTAVTVLVACLAADYLNLHDELATSLGEINVMPYGAPGDKQLIASIDPAGAKADAVWRKKVEAGVKKHGSALAWLLAEPADVMPLLDFLACEVVETEFYGEPGRDKLHATLDLIGVNLLDHWQLTPEWLEAQGKPYILAALEEALGKKAADAGGYAKLKPDLLPEQAHKALVAAGWMPEPMRAPEKKAASKKAGKK